MTLKPFDVTKACRCEQHGQAAAACGCAQSTARSPGSPRPADVELRLGLGPSRTTRSGVTDAVRLRARDAPAQLRRARRCSTSTLTGKQEPVGTADGDAGDAVTTTGTWTMTEGTASLAGRHGTGTYAFTIVRNDSPSVFATSRGSSRRPPVGAACRRPRAASTFADRLGASADGAQPGYTSPSFWLSMT